MGQNHIHSCMHLSLANTSAAQDFLRLLINCLPAHVLNEALSHRLLHEISQMFGRRALGVIILWSADNLVFPPKFESVESNNEHDTTPRWRPRKQTHDEMKRPPAEDIIYDDRHCMELLLVWVY